MGGGFYPHGKPNIYSYTEHFITVGHDYFRESEANTKYPGLGAFGGEQVVIKALFELRALIDGARAAELAFIADTGININDPNNAKEIFNNINLILNSKQTFERGLAYMRNLKDAKKTQKDQMYRDVTRYFATYLGDTVKEKLNQKKQVIAKMNKNEIANLINEIITEALVLSYTKVKDFVGSDGKIRGKFGKYHKARKGEQEVQAITDMIDIIQKLGNSGAFSQFGYLFDMDVDKLAENNNQGLVELKNRRFNKAKVDTNYGGNALELITSMVTTKLAEINIQNKNLTITGKHTGQDNEMKADSLLFVGTGTINPQDYLSYVDTTVSDSKRVQNVDALERYLNTLQSNVQHVIAISDKNYSITSHFDGIAAQEKMNLQNVGELLSKFKVSQVTELINYLANCGASMVQGNVAGEVRTELQALIGYFLFDNLHIEINGSPKVNVVNLMNVSGIYIPLSVYLEGVYDAIQDAASSPSSLVSVSISLGGPTEQSVWTAATWEQFRTEHETQSFISYKILKNIANFITNL